MEMLGRIGAMHRKNAGVTSNVGRYVGIFKGQEHLES